MREGEGIGRGLGSEVEEQRSQTLANGQKGVGSKSLR